MDRLMDSHRALLATFSGPESVDVSASLWSELLVLPGHLCSLCPEHLLVALQPYCQQLASNNQRTGHYAKLMYHVLVQVNECSESKGTDLRPVANSVALLSVVTIHLASILRFRELQIAFSMSIAGREGQDILSDLVASAFRYLQDTAIQPRTYELYWSMLQLLIALSSTQLYSSSKAGQGAFSRQQA